jgi:hypothetical protein
MPRLEHAAKAIYPDNKARGLDEGERVNEAKRFARTDEEKEALDVARGIRSARRAIAAISHKTNGDA